MHFYTAMQDKRFVIISNKVNNYGYRVDTSGMDIAQYERNPVLLFMHQRATWNQDAKPIGTVKELRRESNGDITGVPVFTEATEHAQEVKRMIEDGTYKMLSAGFEVIATSEEPEDIQQGQRYATIKKSKLVEVSVVDIGGDDNAMCLINKDRLLTLDGYSDDIASIIPAIQQQYSIPNMNTMKEQLIPMLLLVGLSKDGTAEQLMHKLTELKQQADQSATLKTQLQQKEDTITTLNETIATLQQAADDAQIDALLDGAVASRKITEVQKPIYKQVGQADPENLKKLLDTMPASPTLQQHLGSATGTADDPLLKLSYEEAHTGGKLAEIKAKYPEYYKQIFKSKFGREPQA